MVFRGFSRCKDVDFLVFKQLGLFKDFISYIGTFHLQCRLLCIDCMKNGGICRSNSVIKCSES